MELLSWLHNENILGGMRHGETNGRRYPCVKRWQVIKYQGRAKISAIYHSMFTSDR